VATAEVQFATAICNATEVQFATVICKVVSCHHGPSAKEEEEEQERWWRLPCRLKNQL